jgi:hypothetical protein
MGKVMTVAQSDANFGVTAADAGEGGDIWIVLTLDSTLHGMRAETLSEMERTR